MPRTTQDTAGSHLVACKGLSPSMADLSKSFHFPNDLVLQSYNPVTAETVTVWANPFSLATTQGITIVFSSSAYLDVSVQRVCDSLSHSLQLCGLPHSDIDGSRVVCTSPSLFAAYHVLRRLREPRHPPCALHSLPSFRLSG